MIKGKLKLPAPDKPRRVFPDRLGSLVSGYEGKDDEIEGSDCEFESGKEREPIQPNALGCDREGDVVDNEDNDDEEESKAPQTQRPIKDVVNPVSVLKAIVMDEKRSDLEHELSQREINMDKLQRIASTGIPDGGSLSATWKWDKELKESREKYA